ncbi:MAG: DUF2171 domain-containing protein [Oscillochloris sp.]|nr:DUF2171 domain-containing protein [Oscillochloris sp.]
MLDPSAIKEHMSVIGSDGVHVGVVDHTVGDMIKLTRSDPAAGGEHHYIPLTWVDVVIDVVQLRVRGREAIEGWRTEAEQQGADNQRDSLDNTYAVNRNKAVGGEVF